MVTGSYLELLSVGTSPMDLGEGEPPLGRFVLTIIVSFELLQSKALKPRSATM